MHLPYLFRSPWPRPSKSQSKISTQHPLTLQEKCKLAPPTCCLICAADGFWPLFPVPKSQNRCLLSFFPSIPRLTFLLAVLRTSLHPWTIRNLGIGRRLSLVRLIQLHRTKISKLMDKRLEVPRPPTSQRPSRIAKKALLLNQRCLPRISRKQKLTSKVEALAPKWLSKKKIRFNLRRLFQNTPRKLPVNS